MLCGKAAGYARSQVPVARLLSQMFLGAFFATSQGVHGEPPVQLYAMVRQDLCMYEWLARNSQKKHADTSLEGLGR